MADSTSPPYALILAGGSGKRFWPLSRDTRPKQLLPLFGEQTLLEQTIRRLDGVVPRENILVLTNPVQLDAVREVCADLLPADHAVAEPERRDTAPAIALAVGWVAARDPEGVMMVLPSDHLIQDQPAFARVLDAACTTAATEEALVTVGIKPTWACPSYGYIERGAKVAVDGVDAALSPLEVRRFREKPSPELAEKFLKEGNYCWNAGMFFWSISTVRQELARHCPELAAFADKLAASPDLPADLADAFAALPRISIDYALMENASRVLNIEAVFDWDDVGSWISVAKYLKKDDRNNRHNRAPVVLDARENIVFNDRGTNIALLGVDDLIVVQTEDALLIANRHEAERIKQLTDLVPKDLL